MKHLLSLMIGPLVVAVSLALGGCASMLAPAPEPVAAYIVTAPSAAWVATDPGPDDHIFRNDKDRSILSSKAACGQDKDLTLEDYSRSALTGVGERQVVRREPVKLGNVAGLRSDIEGHVDTEPYRMSLTVVRIGSCVYDLSLVGTPEAHAKHLADYTAFLNSFKAGEPR